jgi:hypothetical protein
MTAMKERNMMPRQRMLLALSGAVLLCLLAGVALFVGKRSNRSDSSIAKHKVETSPEDALKYWTAGRMRDAKPAKMPHVNAPKRKKRQPRRPPRTSEQQNS